MQRLLAVEGGPVLPRRYLRCVVLSAACLLLVLFAYLRAPRAYPRQAPIAGWTRNRSRNLRLYVLPDNDTTLLQPVWSCGERSPYLLVVVFSALQHAGTRAVIRDTWGSVREVTNASVHLAFMIGTPAPGATANHLQAELGFESARFGDLIQENFVDSYNNLTLKTVFLLKWVHIHCAGARFVMKTDDDMFVNIRSLVLLLLTMERERALAAAGASTPGPLLLGTLVPGARPIFNASHKWYTPKYMYFRSIYPNYLSGTGYVLSSDAIAPLYSEALHTRFFHLEDIFLTGLCARQAGLRLRDHPAFTFEKRRPDACTLGDKSVVTAHHIEQSTWRQLWTDIQDPSLNCTPG